jgi:hypothetical protein
LGALGVAVRPILLPTGRQTNVAYLGDLKVAVAARRGFVFLRLAWAAHSWLNGKASVGYGVVMDGTRDTPDRYSGVFGIPAVRVLGKILVWQFPCKETERRRDDERFLAAPEPVADCYRKLSKGRYACPGANPTERSEMPPIWLLHPNGLACGLVEDTRRAKRLHADDGSELRSAHLSFFAFQDPAAGAEILSVARRLAAAAGHPALFVALAPQDAQTLELILGPAEIVVAPATVFGHGLDDGVWNINSSEI